MGIVKIIQATRWSEGQSRSCVYLATVQGDNWLYFNDDIFWRCKLDKSVVQLFYINKQIWVNTDTLTINSITDLNSTAINNIVNGGGTTAPAGQGVEDALVWAKAIADDDSHGYDQGNRWGPDYDCSSFVYEAFRVGGGFDLPVHSGYTGTMIDDFTAVGFTWIPGIGNTSSELQRGDILLNITDHVEIYLGMQQNIGAHINEFGGITGGQSGDQSGNEISISGYYSYPWNGILRMV